jgi:F420H(2)-dependent quinone reductase
MPTPSEIRALNRSVIEEFRASNGKVTHPRLRDVQLILLTTTGARTGRPHTTPLAYFSDGPGRIVLWASAMAAPSHPGVVSQPGRQPHGDSRARHAGRRSAAPRRHCRDRKQAPNATGFSAPWPPADPRSRPTRTGSLARYH